MSVHESVSRTTGSGTARHNRGRILSLVSVVAAAGFVVAVVLAGSLDPGYSQRSEAISALASYESQAAGVMTIGFVCLAIVALAAGTALFGRLHDRTGRVGAVLVVPAGLLTLVATAARQSCSTLQQSCLDRETAGTVAGSHVVHNLVSLLLYVLLVVAGGLIAASLRRDPLQRKLFRARAAGALAALVFLAWFGSQAYGANGGLVQRVFVLLAYGLPVAVAFRLTRPPRVDGASLEPA